MANLPSLLLAVLSVRCDSGGVWFSHGRHGTGPYDQNGARATLCQTGRHVLEIQSEMFLMGSDDDQVELLLFGERADLPSG